MRCPSCGTENRLGVQFCAGCGVRLTVTNVEAHAQALASVRHENWEKTFQAMSRALFLFLFLLVGAVLFRAYANREVLAEFSAGAPLPPPPSLALTPAFIGQPALPVPPTPPAPPLRPDKASEPEILAELAQTARDRLNCNVVLKNPSGVVRGWLLFRDKNQVKVITKWGPPIGIRAIDAANVDAAKSQFPE